MHSRGGAVRLALLCSTMLRTALSQCNVHTFEPAAPLMIPNSNINLKQKKDARCDRDEYGYRLPVQCFCLKAFSVRMPRAHNAEGIFDYSSFNVVERDSTV